MPLAITSEVVVAYAQCPRKAYFLLFGQDKGHHTSMSRSLPSNNKRTTRDTSTTCGSNTRLCNPTRWSISAMGARC